MEKAKKKNIGVRLDQEIIDAIEKGKNYVYENSSKVVSNSTFVREAILAYTKLLERDDDIIRGLNNKDRLKKITDYIYYLGGRVDVLQSMIELMDLRKGLSPVMRGKNLWKRLNSEQSVFEKPIPDELRFKTEQECINHYMREDLRLLEKDQSIIITARKFAGLLKEPSELKKMDDMEFYKQSKLKEAGLPNKIDEIEENIDNPKELPNILRQNAFHDPSDDDGPDELTDAEAEEYRKQFFPKDN